MLSQEFFAISLYILILLGIGFTSMRKIRSSRDFILGGRGMNYWLTALSAHASDMSSWIFLAYPAILFTIGPSQIWVALGLTFFMYLNWQLIAPRLRTTTEKYNSLTISSFFESRFSDTTGTIRIFTALITLLFYSIYISAGLVGLGVLLTSLFQIPYYLAITIGILIVTPYLFFGGYITLAWTDLFQGIFLLVVILFVPAYALGYLGGWDTIVKAYQGQAQLESFFPTTSVKAWILILFSFCSWGLGYFGQPHIITKFMGIKNPGEIYKSKYVGIGWQIFALSGATCIGLMGRGFFPTGLAESERLFIEIVFMMFSPFVATIILCGILGATITVMDSQILIVASNLAEDFYKKLLRKTAHSREILLVSRLSIFFVSLVAYVIALFNHASIFALVSYAWFGLGASFGPLLIFALYSKRVNKYGAWAGLISGSIIAAIWPLINRWIPIEIPTLIPGFLTSFFSIWLVSLLTSEEKMNAPRSQL